MSPVPPERLLGEESNEGTFPFIIRFLFSNSSMQRLERYARIALAGLFLSLSLLVTSPTLAQIDTGLQKTAQTAFGSKTPPQADLAIIIGNIIKVALSFVGVIFMVLVVYGGFLWMTAGGAEPKIEKAKSILTSAVVGLVIISADYAITQFVLVTLQTSILNKPPELPYHSRRKVLQLPFERMKRYHARLILLCLSDPILCFQTGPDPASLKTSLSCPIFILFINY